MDIDKFYLIIPFMDFMTRYSIYIEEDKQALKNYVNAFSTGFDNNELVAINTFLETLDKIYEP